MYIVKTTVDRPPYYSGQAFLMYIAREESGFQPLRKREAQVLLDIFRNYPAMFGEPYIMVWDKRELELTNTSDKKRYEYCLSCELEYLIHDLNEDDRQKLLSIPGRVQGFAEKFMEEDRKLSAAGFSMQ